MKDCAHRKWQQVVIRSLCPPSSMNWEIFTTLMSLVYFTASFQQNYFHLKGVWCVWGKLSKVRLTGLAAGSGVGEKLPMLVIGKAEKPQGFKGVKKLPCQHKSKMESWMIMREDLTRSSMLIIDKSPTHPNVNNLKAIELVFLPPNTTSQNSTNWSGSNQGIEGFLSHKCCEASDQIHWCGRTTPKINILEAMRMLVKLWDAVSASTVMSCFKKEGISEEFHKHITGYKYKWWRCSFQIAWRERQWA